MLGKLFLTLFIGLTIFLNLAYSLNKKDFCFKRGNCLEATLDGRTFIHFLSKGTFIKSISSNLKRINCPCRESYPYTCNTFYCSIDKNACDKTNPHILKKIKQCE